MSLDLLLLLAYVGLALGISFLCSVLEAVLLSVTPAYIARMRDERPVVHARLAKMKLDAENTTSTPRTTSRTLGGFSGARLRT